MSEFEEFEGTDGKEWVALQTFSDQHERLFEQGGIYREMPLRGIGGEARDLVAGEPEVRCPRCDQRFAESSGMSAEECRDLHFDGDDDLPSICCHIPARLVLVSDRTVTV